MPTPSAYAETEPAPQLLRCSVPNCRRGVHARRMCSMHYQRWRLHGSTEGPQRRRCLVPGCDEQHYGHGWCAMHWRRWKATGDPLTEPESPFYADLPCPACHSRYTVPFDPRPERAGRGPSSGLGTCVSCGHVFSSLPLPASGVGPPAPETGCGRDGKPELHTKVPGGLASAAVGPNREGAA